MRISNDPGRGTGSMPIVQSMVGGLELLERVEPEWRALCDEGPCAAPFFRPEWIAAYLRAFEPSATLRLVVATDAGRLRAVLPLVAERSRLRGFPVRKLRSAAGVHSCRFDLVHGAGDFRPWADAIWSHLCETGGWDVIELRDVPAGGAVERLLEAASTAGYPVGRWESMRTPYVELPGRGGSFEAVLGRTRSHFRANLRRRMKRLAEKGRVQLNRFEDADPRVLQRFYALEKIGWKGDRGTAIDCDGATRAFYDRAASWAASRGMLAIYELELDGAPVAMHFGLSDGRRYYLPKPAFDPAHEACSPGQLLMHEVLRDCTERGLEELDFLGPPMPWKADWTDSFRPHAWCYFFRRGPLGLALHAAKFRVPALAEAILGR
ncbi:GNAT family N-acetyltransferase [Vulgatibacter incomptus]|uniref:BioF2-like acetyltransferase domain-containing protein n=1 Tax=Vulgatibacter incomptus TaxID=1391653 RepID=A0A0K1PAV8_9BACT|nr:GNAT family N-acetyltransferase [Vulgatibacter incomptus]AKU90660.1 hypothetical protein AKJ08_1047 [Vulgatibacter incomptus]